MIVIEELQSMGCSCLLEREWSAKWTEEKSRKEGVKVSEIDKERHGVFFVSYEQRGAVFLERMFNSFTAPAYVARSDV
jgi:hypothetical protein